MSVTTGVGLTRSPRSDNLYKGFEEPQYCSSCFKNLKKVNIWNAYHYGRHLFYMCSVSCLLDYSKEYN